MGVGKTLKCAICKGTFIFDNFEQSSAFVKIIH